MSLSSAIWVWNLILLKIKQWPYQKDDTVFKTVKKEQSVYLPYEAIVSKDRDPHWLVAESKVWLKKGSTYNDNFLKIIRSKTSLKSLCFSYSILKLKILEENATAACPIRPSMQI